MNVIHKILLIITILLIGYFVPYIVWAQCPVCTVAIGAGVGLCRYLGIDDLVTGLWIGAFLLALSVITDNWLANKFKFYKQSSYSFVRKGVWLIIYYTITFIPLKLLGITGNIHNKIWFFDKLLFSSIIGMILLSLGIWLDKLIKQHNNGKVLFYYQKVVIPILLLTIASIIINFTLC